VKFNWNQTGMPVTLVNRLGQRNEFSEFKTVLNDANNHVVQAVDSELIARGLVEFGGREIVEMVRELTASLANAEKELEAANRRYERLAADLARRGIGVSEDVPVPQESEVSGEAVSETPSVRESESSAAAAAEWEEWDRRFRSLLG